MQRTVGRVEWRKGVGPLPTATPHKFHGFVSAHPMLTHRSTAPPVPSDRIVVALRASISRTFVNEDELRQMVEEMPSLRGIAW